MQESKQYTEKQRLNALAKSPWLFCKRCQRVSMPEEWLPVAVQDVKWNSNCQPRQCPYVECDGRLDGDVMRWWRAVQVRPLFPDKPERGIVYDLRVIDTN